MHIIIYYTINIYIYIYISACVRIPPCLLPEGTGGCADTNECSKFPCPGGMTCNNTAGSYTCYCQAPYYTVRGHIYIIRTYTHLYVVCFFTLQLKCTQSTTSKHCHSVLAPGLFLQEGDHCEAPSGLSGPAPVRLGAEEEEAEQTALAAAANKIHGMEYPFVIFFFNALFLFFFQALFFFSMNFNELFFFPTCRCSICVFSTAYLNLLLHKQYVFISAVNMYLSARSICIYQRGVVDCPQIRPLWAHPTHTQRPLGCRSPLGDSLVHRV
jgi:hypothetical protein